MSVDGSVGGAVGARWCGRSVGWRSRSSTSCGCSTSAGRIDPTVGDQGESARTMRDKLETARALESLPEIAAAAYEGDLSG